MGHRAAVGIRRCRAGQRPGWVWGEGSAEPRSRVNPPATSGAVPAPRR
ncbi:hypothetical protein C7S15_2272 [Burkholderia cepacia]|nr:hypothetical protein [Burkholderia cepacia]